MLFYLNSYFFLVLEKKRSFEIRQIWQIFSLGMYAFLKRDLEFFYFLNFKVSYPEAEEMELRRC